MLWQLSSDGRDYCGVRYIGRHKGIEDEPISEQASAFVDDMLNDDGEIRAEYDDMGDWEQFEATHGEIADLYLSA
nr:hypothetical protein [Halorhabdus tiamatea]